MCKIVKWFKSVINWFKNLFKKKEHENPTSGTTQPVTPPTPSQPTEMQIVAGKMVDVLTSWEEVKTFREYVNENGITEKESLAEFEYNNALFEEEVKNVAAELLYALNKSEDRYQDERRRKIETWAMYCK